MTPKDIERLRVAADLAYARALKDLAPVEAERRRLEAAREKAQRAATIMLSGSGQEPTAADLAVFAQSRAAARRRVEQLQGSLDDLAPKLHSARTSVRKALAKTEVVSALGDRLVAERRIADDRQTPDFG